MSPTVPIIEPLEIYAGDSVTWRKSHGDYPASDGWALRYDLSGPAESVLQVTSSGDGNAHLIEISAAITAEWAAGYYAWACRAVKGDERKTLATGTLQVKADPAGGADSKPHCKKVLDAIEAVLEGRATHDQRRYEVAGKSVERMDLDELLKLRRIYKTEWENLQRKQQGKTSRLIKARF